MHTYSAGCTISEVNLSAFIYRLFHEDFSSIVGANTVHEALSTEHSTMCDSRAHLNYIFCWSIILLILIIYCCKVPIINNKFCLQYSPRHDVIIFRGYIRQIQYPPMLALTAQKSHYPPGTHRASHF